MGEETHKIKEFGRGLLASLVTLLFMSALSTAATVFILSQVDIEKTTTSFLYEPVKGNLEQQIGTACAQAPSMPRDECSKTIVTETCKRMLGCDPVNTTLESLSYNIAQGGAEEIMNVEILEGVTIRDVKPLFSELLNWLIIATLLLFIILSALVQRRTLMKILATNLLFTGVTLLITGYALTEVLPEFAASQISKISIGEAADMVAPMKEALVPVARLEYLVGTIFVVAGLVGFAVLIAGKKGKGTV